MRRPEGRREPAGPPEPYGRSSPSRAGGSGPCPRSRAPGSRPPRPPSQTQSPSHVPSPSPSPSPSQQGSRPQRTVPVLRKRSPRAPAGRTQPGPRWLPPLAAAAALAAVPLLVVPLKAWTERPGPDGLPLDAGGGFYPSGHTATAVVAYGAAALLLRPRLRRELLRRAVAAAVVLLNLAVGAGLVVRGYHWPLDVAGAWLLCGPLLWALSGPLGARGSPRDRGDREDHPNRRGRAGPRKPRPRAGPAPAAPGR
ncbi:phosphatase PAP2 family protein [Streptomyces sp. PLAI1-29]|uniref:Phosphatase PAP2 family protein n=1 Tax=Streptomyces zingiberis TaxID=2053010 RepID=A0ABX1C0Z2_9ACTN|nr:phosphatase PAP2 family protein [Streptomyces zingiberis]